MQDTLTELSSSRTQFLVCKFNTFMDLKSIKSINYRFWNKFALWILNLYYGFGYYDFGQYGLWAD